jgi:hypothetical protein
VFLKAACDLAPGSEVLVGYGAVYWEFNDQEEERAQQALNQVRPTHMACASNAVWGLQWRVLGV